MIDPKDTDISNDTAHQALRVSEILEAILLQLPISDLLVNAQLVSHQWKSAITSSTKLQQALFFRPSENNIGEALFNPLLQKFFPPWFDGTGDPFSRGKAFRGLPWADSVEHRDAAMRKEASWRKMLPITPPPKIFEVVKRSSYQRGSKTARGQVQFSDGVTMGTLYDYAYKSVKVPITAFLMDWHLIGVLKIAGVVDPTVKKDPTVVTMKVNFTFQCVQGMGPDVGKEFQSEAFENLGLVLEQTENGGS